MDHDPTEQNLNGHKEKLSDLKGLPQSPSFEKNGVFQHVVGLASLIFKVPIALINFVDETDFKIQASVGLDGLQKVSKAIALCSYAIDSDTLTVFENTKEERCLLHHPMVDSPSGFKFYAGAPLITKNSHHIGLLAIGDVKPRKFEPEERQILENLAALVVEELESKIQKSR